MPKRPSGRERRDQRWSTFLRTHAKAIVARLLRGGHGDVPTFRLLFVFVVIGHGARRVLHFNVTQHPSAEWTLQRLRGLWDTAIFDI